MARRASWDTSGAEIFFADKPLILDKALKNFLRLENTIKTEDCPPGMWACKKKSPPGVWSCSAKKQT